MLFPGRAAVSYFLPGVGEVWGANRRGASVVFATQGAGVLGTNCIYVRLSVIFPVGGAQSSVLRAAIICVPPGGGGNVNRV